MKKVLCAMIGILMLVLTFSMASCSGQETNNNQNESVSESEYEQTNEVETMPDKEDMPYKPIQVNTTFTDNMVLQRNKKVRIFGYGGNPGETVRVKFQGKTYKGYIEEEGWEVWLDPMEADKNGKELEVIHRGKTVTFRNVVVGEVWLCGGQSNMAVTVQYIYNKDKNVRTEYSEYENWDSIRVYNRSYKTSEVPVIDSVIQDKWQMVSNFQGVRNSSASAVAFALNLAHMLGDDVPIGVLNCSVGGSPIEGWISREGMSELRSYFEDQNSIYYHGMLYNLLGYSFGGFFWYQGCANAQPHMSLYYRDQFEVMLQELRLATGDEKLPTVVMQLVQFEDWCPWNQIRQVQWELMELENVYTVCGIDLGVNITPYSEASKQDGIHPTDKWMVGKRAAGVVASEILKIDPPQDGNPYGVSPTLDKAVWKDGAVRVSISGAKSVSQSKGVLGGFEVYIDNKWVKAEATLEGSEVVLTVEEMHSKPFKIRYLQCNVVPDEVSFLYNEYGLPVAPARYVAVTEG